MPPSLLILQPTPYCNLDCSYCYLKHRDDRSRMSDDVLYGIARHILAPCPPEELPAVLWHGGEPMTVPPKWYEHAFALLARESGHDALHHSFQTNAIGVNSEWIALWKKWQVNLGISIDGPAWLHDIKRKTRAGGGSHQLVLNGLKKIHDAGLDSHVITVLNAESLSAPDALYDFYVSNGVRDVGFNTEEYEGQTDRSSLENAEDAQASYHAFLQRIQALIDQEPESLRCREVEIVHEMMSRPHEQRGQNGQVTPLAIVTVCVDGSLSTFSPELAGIEAPEFDNFIFGNIQKGGADQMLFNPAFQKAKREIDAGVAACSISCGYFDVCGGGAPSNKFFELGSMAGTETLYCQLTLQTTMEAVLDTLETRATNSPKSCRSGT